MPAKKTTKTTTTEAKPKVPTFKLTFGKTNGTDYTFTKKAYSSLTETMARAEEALKSTGVREVIIVVK
ncbi:MAG: hypothetical protein WC822_02455 [Candidatus Paceibacterota bacterium]|jgi:hypothetical protein